MNLTVSGHPESFSPEDLEEEALNLIVGVLPIIKRYGTCLKITM